MEQQASSSSVNSGASNAGGASGSAGGASGVVDAASKIASSPSTMKLDEITLVDDSASDVDASQGDDGKLLGFDAWESLDKSAGDYTEQKDKNEDKTKETGKADDTSKDAGEVSEDKNVDQPEVQPEAEKNAVKPPARILDGLDPQEAQAFKKMSNESYNLLYPRLLQFKKDLAEKDKKINEYANKALDANKAFYTHEEGYRLSPEFSQGVQRVQGLNIEAEHWRKQLVDIENGAEEWEDLGRDADGNYFVTAKHPATPQNKVLLTERLNNTNRIKDGAMEQLRSLQKSHKDKYSKALDTLKAKQVEAFPESKDENHAGWKVAQEIINTFLPEELRSDPLAKTLGFAGYKILEMQKLLKAYMDKEKTETVLQADKAKQTTVKGTLGKATPGSKTLSWEEMQRIAKRDDEY